MTRSNAASPDGDQLAAIEQVEAIGLVAGLFGNQIADPQRHFRARQSGDLVILE